MKRLHTPSNQNLVPAARIFFFQEANIKLGLTRDSRDKAIFPTKGVSQSLTLDLYAPLSSDSLFFYTFRYHAAWLLHVLHVF